mgnify:FL=1
MKNISDFQPSNSQHELPNLTIFDLIRLMMLRKWIILSSLSITLLVSGYISLSTTPVYLATAEVMIEKHSKAEAIFNFGAEDPQVMSNEIQIMKSRTLANSLVEALWNSEYRNKIHILGTRLYHPRGQSIRQPLKKFLSFGNWSPEMDMPAQYYEKYSSEIGSRFSENIRSSLRVNHRRGTNILEVTFSSPEPHEAALLANTFVKVYKELDREWSADESQQMKSFLLEQIKSKENELTKAEILLKDFKEKHKLFSLEANANMLLAKVIDTESEIFITQADINISEKEKLYIEEKLSQEEKDLALRLTTSLNSRLFALRSEISNYESELVTNSSLYGENHGAVKITSEKLNALKKKLEEQTSLLIDQGLAITDPIEYRQNLISKLVRIESETESNKSKLEEYDKLLSNYNIQLGELPAKQMEYSRLEREFKVLSETYQHMRQKLEEASITSASEPGKVRIIDTALPSHSAVKPDIPKNLLMSLFFGLFIGISIIISKEYLDSTIKSADYINRLGLPILAIIPAIGESYRKKRKGKRVNGFNSIKKMSSDLIKKSSFSVGKIQRRLVTQEDPKSPVSEAYRALRTSLLYSTIDKNKKTIMVSSPGPGEGKTTTIINLAITYANLGKRTLLIDGDLRRPVLHKVFGTSKDVGLTHYLTGNLNNYKDIVKTTDVENLELITCGVVPPNPSELLASPRLIELIPILEKKYDIILFDAPPILAVTDAVVLSQLVSQFIMVVRIAVTDKGGMLRSINSMSQVKANVSGVVLNDMDYSNSYYSGNYYNYYNYYYYGSNAE